MPNDYLSYASSSREYLLFAKKGLLQCCHEQQRNAIPSCLDDELGYLDSP